MVPADEGVAGGCIHFLCSFGAVGRAEMISLDDAAAELRCAVAIVHSVGSNLPAETKGTRTPRQIVELVTAVDEFDHAVGGLWRSGERQT
jgi:hypothetical protein